MMDRYRRRWRDGYRYDTRRRDGFGSDTRDFISKSVKGDHFREFLSDKTKLTQEQIRELIARSKDFNRTERLKVKSDGGTQFVLLPAGTIYSRDSRSTVVGWSTSLSEALYLSIGYRKETEPLGLYEDDVIEYCYKHDKGFTRYLVSKIQRYVDLKDGKVKEAKPESFTDKILSVTRLHTRLAWYNTENVRCYYNMMITFDLSIVSKHNAIECEKKEPPNTMEQALSNLLTVGKISCSDKVICKGDMGTVVEGVYHQRADIVCIKKGQNRDDGVSKKISIVNDLCNANDNFVKVYGIESNRNFLYAAIEHCDTSLKKFLPGSHHLKDHNNLLEFIREIVTALAWLHSKGISHGKLNLDSIFVDKYFKPKIKMPVISSSKDATDDMFGLGGIIFFCLTGREYKRENLTKLKPSEQYLNPIYYCSDALDLLRKLLDQNPAQRATSLQASNHTLFWSPSKKLQFIRAIAERLELQACKFRNTIERINEAVFGRSKSGIIKSWEEKVPARFLKVMQDKKDEKGNNYSYNIYKVYDLLRIIRNLMSHEESIKKESKNDKVLEMFGEAGYPSYFQQKIPNLVNEVYNVMRTHIQGEAKFREYYPQEP